MHVLFYIFNVLFTALLVYLAVRFIMYLFDDRESGGGRHVGGRRRGGVDKDKGVIELDKDQYRVD